MTNMTIFSLKREKYIVPATVIKMSAIKIKATIPFTPIPVGGTITCAILDISSTATKNGIYSIQESPFHIRLPPNRIPVHSTTLKHTLYQRTPSVRVLTNPR